MNEEKSNEKIRITDHQMMKIKLGLSSLTNSVVVCPMVATLYTQPANDAETWSYCKRGVPGIICIFDLDKEIIAAQIVIADPDSGFALWRDALTQSSNYKASQRNFHTFQLISGNSMAGIRFPTDETANIFLQNVLCNIPKPVIKRPESPIQLKQNFKKNKFSIRRLRKDEISSPCMFTHVTSVNNKPQRTRTMSHGKKGNK